jgi:hypothetical protein
MTAPLPDRVRQGLDRPELAVLWRRVRKQLERTGAEPRGAVTVPIDNLETASEVGALLGKRLTHRAGGSTRVELADLDRRLRTGPAQLGLAQVISALTGEPLLQRQTQRAERASANSLLVTELLQLMADVPELDAERQLLEATTDRSVLRVPPGTATGTTSWSVYEVAVRAACLWWPATREGRRLAAKELAGRALRGSKRWTNQRQLAFANLAQQPFDHAVDEADIPIRMSGPLIWKSRDTLANAAAVHPWIALPAQGIRTLGYVDCTAQGILLVENTEAFEKVCVLDGITDRWLCVWNQGNPSKRLMRFLAILNLPVAAWCDLDAYGIRMIRNLEKELGRMVTPVGMEVDLWRHGTKLLQDDGQLIKARALAASMSTMGPVALRELATAIAETGDCCEQETLYDEVLPTLKIKLRALEEMHGHA